MVYELWNQLEQVKDPKNPFTKCYRYENGDTFYVEPVYLLKLSGMEQFVPESINKVVDEMERLVRTNHLVVFIGDEDEEITEVDGAIYLTIQDVCNPIHVYVEDKSRGSDYGD